MDPRARAELRGGICRANDARPADGSCSASSGPDRDRRDVRDRKQRERNSSAGHAPGIVARHAERASRRQLMFSVPQIRGGHTNGCRAGRGGCRRDSRSNVPALHSTRHRQRHVELRHAWTTAELVLLDGVSATARSPAHTRPMFRRSAPSTHNQRPPTTVTPVALPMPALPMRSILAVQRTAVCCWSSSDRRLQGRAAVCIGAIVDADEESRPASTPPPASLPGEIS